MTRHYQMLPPGILGKWEFVSAAAPQLLAGYMSNPGKDAIGDSVIHAAVEVALGLYDTILEAAQEEARSNQATSSLY